MNDSIESQNHISVFETSISYEQHNLTVYNIIIQSAQSTVSLIRYPFDLIELHQKIRYHYPKVKLSFPHLNHNLSQNPLKRRSFRDLFSRKKKKSNVDKIQIYLENCFGHPILRRSSILRDFTKVQREEDSTLTEPQTTLADLELLQVLGQGCMGKVMLVRHQKRLCALKSIKKKWIFEQKEWIHSRAERDILVQVRHQPFLAQLQVAFQTEFELNYLLDYYPGGDLATQLSIHHSFSLDRTRLYTAEILQGLEALHQAGIIYRDLKPENVLIDREGHVILTDFGLSKIFKEGEDRTTTFCGTAEYLAPEILLSEPYTFTVDFWSLGTLSYEMLAGTTPFWADNPMDMYKRVLEDKLSFPKFFDSITIDFLSRLLEKEPHERLGWGKKGIEDIKTHGYFNSMDWNKVKQREIKPEFIPEISSETDISNFDPVFTDLPVKMSQSSKIDIKDYSDIPGLIPGIEPFEGFEFDGTNSKQLVTDSRKRTNVSIEAIQSIDEEHRVLKKRQTHHHLSTTTEYYIPYERPNCPIPGQERPNYTTSSSHSSIIRSNSNVSTLNQFICL